MTNLGATAEDWLHFDLVLGLGANLLPCVPYSADVKVAEGSALVGKIGKIPSAFNGRGEAHGLKEWQSRTIEPWEVTQWSNDRRLDLCVRTGPISGIYAFDIDIDDERTDLIREDICDALEVQLPERYRHNSEKQLLMFRMEEPCKKRKIKLDDEPRGPAIELLADGQQFVACGTHSSGTRYQWFPELPSSIPTITLAQLDSIWTTLTQRYAKSSSTTESTAPARETTDQTAEVLTTISEEDWPHLLARLWFLLDKVSDNDSWSELGYALLSLKPNGRQLWLDFSRQAAGYEPGAAEAWWDAHKGQQPRTDWRHIFSMAHQRGFKRVASPDAFPPVTEPDPNADLIDVMPPEVGQGKPVVRISGAEFSNIIKQLESIISPDVYTQGASLVRTTEAHSDGAIQRSADAVMLIQATPGWAKIRFGELCEFQKYDARQQGWVPIAPSNEHIGTLLDRGSWTVLRPLDAIARAPFLRADGSVCTVPGYDPSSRTLYVPSIEFPAIPEQPTRAEASAALERLRAPFNEFPWKEPASEAAFVSHILAEAARLAMERCPMYFYDAPMAGTGKSTLQEMAARIVHGTEPALRPWVADEDELRKSIYACLMAGDRSIWFDNVPDGHKVRSSVLEAFLTSAVWKDRKLGESVTSAIPNKTVLVASGNNLTPVSALARRSIVVRLDANTEHLRERVFKIQNPRRYVMEHRARYLVDALTIIRAYLLHSFLSPGAFAAPVTLPSFEDWSRLAREPLLWLGMADPVITQLNETDDENQNVGPVFERLAANFGERTFTAGDMARIVGSLSDEKNELSDSLMHMGCMEPTNPIKVGYWLRATKDKIGSGYKLVHDGHNKFGVRWKLQKMNGDLV
jgi:putative DNA primase/helicase